MDYQQLMRYPQVEAFLTQDDAPKLCPVAIITNVGSVKISKLPDPRPSYELYSVLVRDNTGLEKDCIYVSVRTTGHGKQVRMQATSQVLKTELS